MSLTEMVVATYDTSNRVISVFSYSVIKFELFVKPGIYFYSERNFDDFFFFLILNDW